MTKSDVKRRFLLALLAVMVLGLPLAAGSIATAKPEEVGLSTDRLQRVREAVQQHIEARGWAGAFGTNVNMDPKEKMVTVVFIQNQGGSGALHRDFENAVMQAIIE